ncbi:hypothetical protein RB595_009208 [Gaeumannomyces hyphopodioides]
MAPRRDLLRRSSSAEPRGGFLATILFSSPPDLGRRQNDGNRDRDRSGNGNGGGSNNGGRNGNGGGDPENRNGRNFRGGGGDSNDSGRGENGRGGGGNGFGGGGGGRGDGGGGSNGNNRGDGGSGRFGNNRNDGGSDGGSRNRGDGGGGERNNDDSNNNNSNRFRNGGNRNGDGRDRGTTTAQTASSATPTSSPAPSSASAPPTTEASARVPVSSVSSIPEEVNGAISASPAISAPASTTTDPAATTSSSAGSSAPVAGSETAAPAPSTTSTSIWDPAAATPSPPATTGDIAPGPGTSSETTATVSISTAGQSFSSLASGVSSTSIPTLNPAADANSVPASSAGIGIGDGAARDPQWQKSGNEMPMGQREVMSGTTERVLISVGSIGAFVFVSFLAWIILRTARKSKRRKETQMYSDYRSSGSHERPGISQRLAAKLPFLRSRQQQHWLNITDRGYGDQKDRPLTFGPSEVPVAPIKGFYGSEKVDSLQAPLPTLAPPQSQQSPRVQPRVQSPLPQLRLQTEQLSGATAWPPTSPESRKQEQMGGPTWPMDPTQWQQMQFQAAFAAASNAYSPGGLSPGTGTETSMFTHQATGSFSSTNAAQFGASTPSSDVGGTWRSRMGPVNGYYNQSELARQPSDAYDPSRRQVGRASALSSLSSGFGDGDIVVPQQPRQPLAGPAHGDRAVGGNESEAQRYLTEARASWASRRDTVYTESSDDSQPRYRTVTSWVRQQSGRVRRAEQRGIRSVADDASDGDVEGSSERAMPPEPRFNMMMDDGQAPRSPETMSGAGVFAPSRQRE